MRAISRKHATVLSEKGWLSQIPNALRGDVLSACLCYDLDSRQAITHGGEVTGGLFGIISGTAGVFSTFGPDGPLIHVAGPAFWFGLFPITNGRPRIISVIARTPCVVAHLPQASLQKVLNRKPEMWRWLNLLSLESAVLAIQALTDVLINDKERRCAAALLRTAGCRDSGNAPTTARLTQDDLAVLSNVSRATVSVVVRRLAAQKFISLGYKAITIHSPVHLRRLLELRSK